MKAEVESSKVALVATGKLESQDVSGLESGGGGDVDMSDESHNDLARGKGQEAWLEISIDVPGMRDDDALPVFLSAMLTEALLADGELKDRLWMNRRFHWRLYIDVSQAPHKCRCRHTRSC